MTIPVTTTTISLKRPSSDHSDDHDWAKRGEFWNKQNKTQTNRIRANSAKMPNILSLAGHGVRFSVDNGALVIRNGFTHYPQQQETWRLFAGQRNLPDRIVMLDGNGSLTFEVLAWLSKHKIPLIQINWQGEAITVLGANSYVADARLLDAQRTAIGS